MYLYKKKWFCFLVKVFRSYEKMPSLNLRVGQKTQYPG
jgi:hypothetical protein